MSHKANTEPADNAILLSSLSDKGVLTLTLNRPDQFNALSEAMLDALQHELDNIKSDTRVVVIQANGKAFCAGHDLHEMRAHANPDSGDEQWQKMLFGKCSRFMQTLVSIPQPVIAKVQGLATAAGCQLVANCDLAIASSECKFGVSGINLGLFCSTPSVALSRNLSRKRAFQMLMTGEFINTTQAVEWGLLNSSVEPDLLNESVDNLCKQICSKSQVAVSAGKGLFYNQLEMPLADAYELAGATMACNMMSDDVKEGIDAFFEKRQPEWKNS